MRSVKVLAVVGLILAGSLGALAQANLDLEQGIKPYGSYHGGSLDHINIQNGNLFFQAGLFSYAQRGELAYPIVLQYNNKNFSLFQTQPGCAKCPVQSYVVFGADPSDPTNNRGAGVTLGFDGLPTGSFSEANTGLSLNGNPISINLYSVKTSDGGLHPIVNAGSAWIATDGSGFRADSTLRDRNGSRFSNFAEDANGNQLTSSASGWTDTLGRQIPAVPGPATPADPPPSSTASLSACPALNYPNQPVTFAYTWNLPTVNGGTLPLVLCYASVYVRTNFFGSLGNGPKFFDLQQSFTMLQSVVFPDNTFWAFQYDAADPNNSASIAFADLRQITLPTGGTLNYTWGAWSTPGCGTGIGSRAVVTRTVNGNDGSGAHTWNYSGGIVADPAGNETLHTFSSVGANCSFYETQTQYYQGSHTAGTLLKTVTTDYQFTTNPYDSKAISTGRLDMAQTVANVFPIRVTTTLPNGLVSKVETDYDAVLAYHGPLDGIQYNDQSCVENVAGDPSTTTCWYTTPTTMPVTNYTGSYGKVIAEREYDWGQGAPGPLLRQTKTTYQWQVNNAYLAANLMDLPASVQVLDGAGNQVALTTYGYDESPLASSGVTTQHNATPSNGSVRGNRTSTHHWLNTTNSTVDSSATYFDTGELYQATDPLGHTTTYAYSSSFAGAYPTSVTNAKNQTASTNYDFSTGLVISSTDTNGQVTTTSYDSLWRPSQVNHPDGGQVNFCYTDTGGAACSQSGPPFKVVVTKKIDATRNMTATAVVDGLGRKTEAQLNSDPSCPAGTKVDTTYDALGRVATVTNAFCATTDATYGVTSYAYDALGRTTQVTHPDGSTASTSYSGRAVQLTDEGNGTRSVQRISQSDGLGRLASVCEVSSTTLSFGNGAAPAACGQDIAGTGFLTSYTYDTLGNLTGVSQGGYLPRSFTYDSLSRLLTATNPESGTISYTYDAASKVITKTDARNITTTYAYDVLDRLTSKSYSDGTPTASFVYDTCPAGGCPTGVTPALTTGRMVEASTANARSFYSYDTVGRVKNLWECAPVNCAANTYWALTSSYDLNGDVTSESNGLGVILSSAYDTAARLTGVTSNLVDASHPANLLSNIQYNAPGLPKAQTLGNNVNEVLAYDTRMRLTSLAATSPTAVGATAGGGSVIVNGSERSYQSPATTASGSVTISGDEQSKFIHGIEVDDAGTVTITVNGHADSASYNIDSTSATIASGLVNAINGDSAAPVSATLNGSTVNLTSKASGAAANYPLAVSSTSSAGFSPPSFAASASGGNLTGGVNASTTYDSGTVSITVNGVPASVAYSNASTSSSTAAALASALTSGTLVNATATGNTISITSKTTGAASNYSLAVSSSSSNGFSPPSFTGSTSGPALTGGSGASSGMVYSLTLGYAPNGNVLTANDSVNGSWTYGYDDFNRLVSSNKNRGQQTYSYVHDRFGNRWQQNAPQGGSVSLATFSAGNNRMDGAGYDAAGNMIHDPTTGANYTYDAENRIISVNNGAVTYAYDADGQRVEKNVGGVKTDYVYDVAGHAIAEINGSGAVTRQELFIGDKHLGTYTNNTTYFSHGDGLGTERVRSDMTGAACETIQSLPYGDGQSSTGSCGDPSTRHFTGKERDAETGLDYFGARYYSNGLGRWISADWSATPVPVPYADFGDPQSLNLYTYVRNIPTSQADADGHCPYCPALEKIGQEIADSPAGEAIAENFARVVAGVGTGFAVAGAWSKGVLQKMGDYQVEAAKNGNGGVGVYPTDHPLPESLRIKLEQAAQGNSSQQAGNQSGTQGSGAQQSDGNALPKPPTGKGSVPPEERDPKRLSTKTEKDQKLSEQGGTCANCGKQVPPGQGIGHHVKRHADGGKTNKRNVPIVCKPCHKRLHSGSK